MSGTWYPRRVLKNGSRRKRFAGECDATPVVEVAVVLVVVAEMTERTTVLLNEGVGNAGASGTADVYAESCRGTSVRRSPVETIDGGLVSETLIPD
jgi:hypothetical protein